MLRRCINLPFRSKQLFSTTNLPFQRGPFKSATIAVENVDVSDSAEFGTRLWTTLEYFRKENFAAIYLQVPMLYAHYIPIAGLHGFKFHHAEGEIATMLLWLPEGECKVPPFATHHCGVAGVLTFNHNILVVKEKSKLTGWKLPGGYVNLNEEFGAAAEREVFEETGILSKFDSVLAFRHSLKVQFGRGDVYIICRLQPLSATITIDAEIDDAQWMPIPELRKVNKHPMLEAVLDVIDADLVGLKEVTMPSTIPGRTPFKLYLPNL